jgi:hypothetical protein
MCHCISSEAGLAMVHPVEQADGAQMVRRRLFMSTDMIMFFSNMLVNMYIDVFGGFA